MKTLQGRNGDLESVSASPELINPGKTCDNGFRGDKFINRSENDDMATILVIYHSQGGSNRKMAMAVAEGVRSMEGAEVNLKDACDAGLSDLLACDGIVIGSPEYFGYMSGAVKDFFDRTYEQARGKVFRKPYALFVNAGNDGTGARTHIERICIGFQLKKVYDPIVVKGEITGDVLDACTLMGQTVAAGCAAGIY
jgi:flavorubredoxin